MPKEEVAQNSENCGAGDRKNNPGKDLCFGLRGSASWTGFRLLPPGHTPCSGAVARKFIPADQILTIDPEVNRLKSGKMTVAAENGLQLVNVHRECGYPVYPGSIEIWPEDGRLAVINKVDLEEYLKLVVPGEMLLSYGTEALKVQAICARNYAWNKLSGAGAGPRSAEQMWTIV